MQRLDAILILPFPKISTLQHSPDCKRAQGSFFAQIQTPEAEVSMEEHSQCSVDIRLVHMLVCPNCTCSITVDQENLPESLQYCPSCMTPPLSVLDPDAIGKHPFALETHCTTDDRVIGTLAQRYEQYVMLSEISGYLNALKCLPCVGRISVIIQERTIAIEGWAEVFTAEAQTIAQHAITDSLVFAATTIAAHLPETSSYEITYEQSFQQSEDPKGYLVL